MKPFLKERMKIEYGRKQTQPGLAEEEDPIVFGRFEIRIGEKEQ